MPNRKTILYMLLWGGYIVFTWTMFPRWNTSVLIPSLAILALGGWMYGTTRGLALIIPSMAYHYLLLNVLYIDIALYYQSRFLGMLVLIMVVLLTGTLRKHLTGIQKNTERLDRAVTQRNKELAELTRQLIERAETTRINRGQKLHDGIGQQLTGIQLYCSSLAEQLGAEQNTNTSLADSLSECAGQVHNLIRRAARSLFPIQIAKVGLLPAIDELVAYLGETKNSRITLESHGDMDSVPPTTAHQLYRICQEYASHALNHAHAQRVDIQLTCAGSMLRLTVRHNGTPLKNQTTPTPESRLIQYRLEQLQGTLNPEKTPPYSECLNVTTPIPSKTATA